MRRVWAMSVTELAERVAAFQREMHELKERMP